MKQLKQISLFFLGLTIIPLVAVFITNLLFQSIDFWALGLWEFLVFDYALVYVLLPLVYGEKLQKYISNKYVLGAICFSVFWIIEIFLICLYN